MVFADRVRVRVLLAGLVAVFSVGWWVSMSEGQGRTYLGRWEASFGGGVRNCEVALELLEQGEGVRRQGRAAGRGGGGKGHHHGLLPSEGGREALRPLAGCEGRGGSRCCLCCWWCCPGLLRYCPPPFSFVRGGRRASTGGGADVR